MKNLEELEKKNNLRKSIRNFEKIITKTKRFSYKFRKNCRKYCRNFFLEFLRYTGMVWQEFLERFDRFCEFWKNSTEIK